VAALETLARRQAAIPPAPTPLVEKARFSPGWIKTRRHRLELSAEAYGRLVGVSGLTVYLWERGQSRPRKEALARLVAVRDIGRREALRRLEMMPGGKKRATAKPGKKKATKGRRRTRR
jgi:DNA-binding transcriptional regulator YiaG